MKVGRELVDEPVDVGVALVSRPVKDCQEVFTAPKVQTPIPEAVQTSMVGTWVAMGVAQTGVQESVSDSSPVGALKHEAIESHQVGVAPKLQSPNDQEVLEHEAVEDHQVNTTPKEQHPSDQVVSVEELIKMHEAASQQLQMVKELAAEDDDPGLQEMLAQLEVQKSQLRGAIIVMRTRVQ